MKLVGRKKEIRNIEKWAQEDPENRAFLGVKGVGKSLLFETAFSKSKRKAYAEDCQYLFVRTILKPELKGTELTDFLLDCVTSGIDLIEDEAIRNTLHEQQNKSTAKFHSKDSSLRDILETIKDYDYSFILIMDNFQNMGRNNEIGSDQYDYLRSLTELGLMYYWVISDSDFSDIYATTQFTTSFFAQKFKRTTIPQLSENDCFELIKAYAAKKDLELSDDVVADIYKITGGIPGFIEPAILCYAECMGKGTNIDSQVEQLLDDSSCSSLLTSWSRSLTCEQKGLLQEVANRHDFPEEELRERDLLKKVHALGNSSGLGLLVKEIRANGTFWAINSLLFERFILDRHSDFYSTTITTPHDNVVIVEQPQPPVVQYITNNIVVNNVFNPEDAVKALAGLKNFISSGSPDTVPPERLLGDVVRQLPFHQAEWEHLEDSQKDAKLDEYAESVFESEDFQFDTLSDSQMTRFFLTTEILDHLSEENRRNLISAIQVYDLLQFCIDKFGLDFQHSESARGILFAKVYEAILKDNLRRMLNSVDEIAATELKVEGVWGPLSSFDMDKVTIGNLQYILSRRPVKEQLVDICANEIGRRDCNFRWWSEHSSAIWRIQNMRNDCCHAGDLFDPAKLDELISHLFEQSAIAGIIVYDAITERSTQ